MKHWFARHPATAAFSLLAFGVVFLFLRNPDPIFNPAIFAEDGTWTALALREGWMTALFNSRPDYFVFLNTIFLFLAAQAALITGEGGVQHLPYFIALVSYAFFSGFATLAFFTLKRVSSPAYGLLGFFLILMMPLGNTQNEVIGRILQIGFLMPALALMLFFWRDHCEGRVQRLATELGLFFAAGTNPVVFVLAAVYFPYRLFKHNFRSLDTLKENAFLLLIMAALAVASISRAEGTGGIPTTFVATNLFEAVVARSLLYPFVFPWYAKLNNLISLFALLAASLMVFYAIKVSDSERAKRLSYAVLVTTAIYCFLTLLMRPGLTGLLNDYQTTFPDRYFMGINVLVSILAALTVAQLMSNAKARKLGLGAGALIASIYLYGFFAVFEWKQPRMPIREHLSFHEQICASEPVPETDLCRIQIYPSLPIWNMQVPKHYIEKSRCAPAPAPSN